MDIKNLTFKEIEKEFNDASASLVIDESVDARSIKDEVFIFLKSKYPRLKMRQVDYLGNRFEIEYEYTKDFNGNLNYDSGRILLNFSIRAKRTEKLKKVSSTRKKHAHAKHEKPISFSYFDVCSNVPSFEWKNENPDDLSITSGKWVHRNDEAKDLKAKSIKEILEQLEATYQKEFVKQVVQPFVKTVFLHGNKYDTIRKALPDTMKELFDKREMTFEQIADFITANGLVS